MAAQEAFVSIWRAAGPGQASGDGVSKSDAALKNGASEVHDQLKGLLTERIFS